MSSNLDTTLRVRTTTELKSRVDRVAEMRGCDSSDVIREALILKMAEEEERLGLPKLSAGKKSGGRK